MLLYYAVVTLHVIVCVIVVLVVLLQSGKGADLAGAFGGGATQTAFGSRGPASFLSRMTTVAAVVFMITSVTLTLMVTKTEAAKSILDTGKKTSQPAPKKSTVKPVATPSPEQIKRIQEEIEAKQMKQQAAPAPVQGTQKPAPAPADAKKPAPEPKKP